MKEVVYRGMKTRITRGMMEHTFVFCSLFENLKPSHYCHFSRYLLRHEVRLEPFQSIYCPQPLSTRETRSEETIVVRVALRMPVASKAQLVFGAGSVSGCRDPSEFVCDPQRAICRWPFRLCCSSGYRIRGSKVRELNSRIRAVRLALAM